MLLTNFPGVTAREPGVWNFGLIALGIDALHENCRRMT